MTASQDLLHRIEGDPSLVAALAGFSDFDIERRDPIEDLVLPSGMPLRPVAGSNDGGTFFLCGEAGGQEPVLYTDSEGRATLLGADLVEAVTLVVVLPFWSDFATGFTITESRAEFREFHPDLDAERDGLMRALALAPTSEEEAAARFVSVAARTAPDHVPRIVGDDRSRYELLFRR